MKIIFKYLEDILIVGGLVSIITASFLWSAVAGVYVLGGSMLGLGVYFTKYPYKGR